MSNIVIGASMGGLLAARTLADSFEQVTLIERDAFPPMGENRKGVPQGRHTHALLLRGAEILEGMFSGLIDDLETLGAPLIDRPEKDLIRFDGGGYHARFTNENGRRTGALGVSRPLLEGYVRQRVLALPGVRTIEQCDALGLLPSEGGSRVRGCASCAGPMAAPRKAWRPIWLLPPGQPLDMLEPYAAKVSRTLLRAESGRKPRDLPGRYKKSGHK